MMQNASVNIISAHNFEYTIRYVYYMVCYTLTHHKIAYYPHALMAYTKKKVHQHANILTL